MLLPDHRVPPDNAIVRFFDLWIVQDNKALFLLSVSLLDTRKT